MCFETTVLNGFPVTIQFTIEEGCNLDWWIEEINGKFCKKSPEWLYNRIAATKGEEDRIVELCLDNIREY